MAGPGNMATEIDRILDDCLTRITRGESVADCLSRYPQYATQLGPRLQTAVMLRDAYAFVPGPAAKERGRQHLQAALQSLDREEASSRTRRRDPLSFLAGNLRWVAAATATLVIVFLGGGSTLAASQSAIPGDGLYPIKRATEQFRLVLPRSTEGRASLHLVYAERRAQEIGELAERGDVGRLEVTGKELQAHLSAAADLTMDLAGSTAIGELRSRLEASAGRALVGVQARLGTSPASSHGAVIAIFQEVGTAYGVAVERFADAGPDGVSAGTHGTVQLLATYTGRRDSVLPPGVDNLLVHIERIEARLAATDGDRWVVVAQGPQALDVSRLTHADQFLGERGLEPGTYSRIRLTISGTTVVTGRLSQAVTVPTSVVTLTRPFQVRANALTVILLDLDTPRSLREPVSGRYSLAPEISVLSRGPSNRAAQDSAGDAMNNQGPKPRSRVQFEGDIESVADQSMTVLGKSIALAPGTILETSVQAGRSVIVEAEPQPDGGFLASAITLKPERPAADQPRQRPSVELTGVAEVPTQDIWIVGGREVRVTPETRLEGIPAPGARVHVKGFIEPDGGIVAVSINLVGPETPAGDGRSREPSAAQSTPLPATPAPVTPSPTPPPPPVLSPMPSPTPSPQPEAIRVVGTIQLILGLRWQVGGRNIRLSSQTVVEGVPAVGLQAEVVGSAEPDGTIIAASIRVY